MSPDQQPQIIDLVPVQPHVKKVLRTMFTGYEKVSVRKQFTSGFGGSLVYLVRPVRQDGFELPCVVKVDYFDRIQQEMDAFQTHIQNRLPGVAEIQGEAVYPLGTQWAGLRYPLVGDGVFDVESLQDYLQDQSLNDIRYVLEKRLFKSLGTLWQENIAQDLYLQKSYDATLPPNLVVEQSLSSPGEVTHFLHPENFRQTSFATKQTVQLMGFRVTRLFRDDRQMLALDTPRDHFAAFHIRVKLEQGVGNFEVGQTIQVPLYGAIVQTRQDQLRQQLAASMGAKVEAAAPSFTLSGGKVLPNPLFTLSQHLNQSLDVRMATVHADLNLQNVLVEPDGRNVALIDFVNSRRDHVLRDLMQFEMSVVIEIMPDILKEAQLTPEIMVPFYERLHCTVAQSKEMAPPSGLERPFTIVQLVRQAAAPYLFQPGKWDEYYTGLLIHLLGTVRFKGLDKAPTAPWPRQMAFLAAATLQQLLENPKLPCEDGPRRQENTTSLPEDSGLQPNSGGQMDYTHEQKLILHQILTRHYSLAELQDLCFKLNVSYENLAGNTLTRKSQELIQYYERHGGFSELINRCRQERPQSSLWQEFDAAGTGETPDNAPSAPAPQAAPARAGDMYSYLERGMERLLARLGPHHSRYGEALNYEQRLQHNIAAARRHGDTSQRESTRSEIIEQLNALAVAELGISFNQLCR